MAHTVVHIGPAKVTRERAKIANRSVQRVACANLKVLGFSISTSPIPTKFARQLLPKNSFFAEQVRSHRAAIKDCFISLGCCLSQVLLRKHPRAIALAQAQVCSCSSVPAQASSCKCARPSVLVQAGVHESLLVQVRLGKIAHRANLLTEACLSKFPAASAAGASMLVGDG